MVASGGSGIGNWTGYIRDGNIRTTWQTSSVTPPRRAQVYVDLGRSGLLTGAEFMFRRISGARHYEIRVSNDKQTWITVATFTYADPLVWQRASFTALGRYVQILFTNTNGASSLGYLAELRVYGNSETFKASVDSSPPMPTAPATATSVATTAAAETTPIPVPTDVPPTATATAAEVIEQNPTATPAVDLAGSPVPIDDTLPIQEFRRSVNSSIALVLTDGDPETTWGSSADDSAMIYVTADLSEVRHVGSIEWLPGPNGVAGQIRVEIMASDETWEIIEGPTSGSSTEWQVMPINRDTSAIRILITNAEGANAIGGIAELIIRSGSDA
jgi:hypothetical protein